MKPQSGFWTWMWIWTWILFLGILSVRAEDPLLEIKVGNVTRTYYVHLPKNADVSKSLPVVFAFHGGGAQASSMSKIGPFSSVADKEDFIAVYPEGIGKHWNDGRETVVYQVDDLGFVRAMIDDLIKRYHVDTHRIYATGISNGGIFCQRLAFDLSDQFAAVASVAGSVPEKIYKENHPSAPISVMLMSGTADPIVPYQGGEVKKLPGSYGGKVLSAEDSIKFWVQFNQCNSVAQTTNLEDKDPKDGTTVSRSVYSDGKDGTEVVLYKIEGGGHNWPGGIQYLPELVIGRTCRDINGIESIWDFFKKHSRADSKSN
jgi:polyhydroxybutyrate depolymerase